MAGTGPPVQRISTHRAFGAKPRSLGRWAAVAVAIGLLAVLPVVARAAGTEDLRQAAKDLLAKQAGEIQELATWCDGRQLADQATETRRLLGRQDPHKLYVPILPREIGNAEPPADAPPDVLDWDRRFRKLREDQGDALFTLARRAVAADRGLGFDLAMAAIHANPDDPTIRRLFGFQQYAGEWRTAYEVRRMRTGQVWHPDFGWLPKTWVTRYEKGERYLRGRWISAEQDAELHADIDSAWEVETEHYLVRSDHSLAAAAQLAEKLERLHTAWRQVFVGYHATIPRVKVLFENPGRSQTANEAKYDVVFFRDRREYDQRLKPLMPNIEVSIGFFHAGKRTAYFFAGEGFEDRTLYHEATHQLFHQSRPVAPNVGQRANFWIVEGIALYMESLVEEDGYCVLGGMDDQRMIAARYRLLTDGFYVPLKELTGYGMERLQQDPKIATLYSQAAGLTNFLIHGGEGRYRDALVTYLAEVYSGRDRPDSLARLTGVDFAELDRQYRRFLETSPAAHTGSWQRESGALSREILPSWLTP